MSHLVPRLDRVSSLFATSLLSRLILVALVLGPLCSPAWAQEDRRFTTRPIPQLSIGAISGQDSVIEGDSGAGYAVFFAVLTPAASRPVRVTVSTADVSATGGTDYGAIAPVEIVFQPGQTLHTLPVQVFGDLQPEEDETFTVGLSNPRGAKIAQGKATGTIVNDDGALPTFSIGSVGGQDTVVEGDAGTTYAVFYAVLTPASATPAQVTVATEDLTAVGGVDYGPVGPVTLYFAPGQTLVTLPVAVFGDLKPESDETFLIRLSAPVGASIDQGEATGTIVNDD